MEQLRSGDLRRPYISDVLGLELAVNELRFAATAPESNASVVAASSVDPMVRVVAFTVEPSDLLAALAEGNVPDDVADGDHYLLVDGRTGDVEIVPLRLELGRRLLTLVAGERPDPSRDDDRILIAAGLVTAR
jgi:hypothetical protein